MNRGGGGGCAVGVAAGQLREEVRHVRGGGVERGQLPSPNEPTELEQVRPVGLERVTRKAPLELQVGQEVKDEVLEALVREGPFDRCHPPNGFARRATIP
jgi:hypothetical protein